MRTAVLLIAHGSRREEANDDARCVGEQLLRDGVYPIVATCFLELAEPDIAAGATQCVAAGADRVLLLPLFLSPGRHVSEHLEAARKQLQAQYPAVRWTLCKPIGRHRLLLEVLRERLAQGEQDEDG